MGSVGSEYGSVAFSFEHGNEPCLCGATELVCWLVNGMYTLILYVT